MANNLQLGDIVRILAPSNIALHEEIFYIHYYDPNDFMELVHLTSLTLHTISLKHAKLMDSSIEKIILVNRSVHKGFARQNGLLPNTWVDIEFSGDIRSIVIAQITHLEEDMIELVTYPEKDMIYIDFAYKGMPKTIPFKHICICNKPSDYEDYAKGDILVDEEVPVEEAHMEYNPDGELMIDLPDKIEIEQNYRDILHDEYTNTKEIQSDIVSIDSQEDHVDEKIQYSIEAQMNFLLDDFLSMIPDDKRSNQVMRNIYVHLNRFKELRETYSTFDGFGHVNGFIKHDPKYYKPLVESIYNMQGIPKWIVPVVNVQKHVCFGDTDDNIPNDVRVFDIKESLQEEERLKKTVFSENNSNTESNKYEHLYNTLSRDIYTPHSIFVDSLTSSIANDLSVYEDIDMFLGTNGTIESSSVKTGSGTETQFVWKRNKFNMMRFLEPIYYSRFVNKKQNTMKMLMEPEHVNIQSLIYLPQEVVYNSQYLYSNILQSTKFKTPYLFDLMKKTEIFQMDVDFKKDSTIIPYNDTIVDIQCTSFEDDSIYDTNVKHPTFQAFLQAIIPNTFSLIDHYYPINMDKYNVNDYLTSLKPYGITHESLSFGSMQRIQKHIHKNIQNYYEENKQFRETFIQYLLAKYTVSGLKNELYFPILDKIFVENNTQKNEVRKLSDITLTTESREHLKKILDSNNGKLLHTWILLLNLELISPVNMLQPFIEGNNFHNLHHKYIAKKYTSLSELQQDNDKRDLKYDEDYDFNPYTILNQYRKEMSQYPPEQFVNFLTIRLSEEYGCSLETVKDLAEELIQGFKIVKENDYAMLELRPHLPEGTEESFTQKEKEEMSVEASVRKKIQYFKRVNHIWIYDSEIKEEDFTDPKEVLCILENNKTTEESKKTFKNKYGTNMEEIQNNIKIMLQQITSETEMLKKFHYKKRIEMDGFFTKLGNKAYISEQVQSPNAIVLSQMLHKKLSIEERQSNIILFCELYCRDAFTTENSNWKYCKDSEQSIQLVPVAMYDLALGFERGEYVQTFSHLVQTRKVKYLDGRYVFAHGGFILDDIDFSDQNMEFLQELEEQDTWEIQEDENVHYEVDVLKSSLNTYTDKRTRFVFNIISSICRVANIPFDKIEQISMNLSMEYLVRKDIFMGKKSYDLAMKRKNKNTKYPSYENYENIAILDIAVCSLIIAIQTLIPSYEYRKSIGNCVKILDGYPLNPDSGQEGTIVYFSCILRRMRGDRVTQPWSTVSNEKGSMEMRIKKMMQLFLKHQKVNELLSNKRQFIESPVPSIENDVNISHHWVHFLPPLQSKQILNAKSPLRNVEKSVNEMTRSTLKNGRPEQWKYLGMYFSKAQAFTLGFIEIINEIVKEKGSLLKTSKKVAWLENACCNELDSSQNPFEYFSREDERLIEYKKSVNSLQNILEKARLYVKSPFLHMEQTMNYVSLLHEISLVNVSEELMYKTFITLSHLDSPTKPIPLHLQMFLQEKPEEYDQHWSIEEKMEFLKSNRKTMNVNSFRSLIHTNFRNNKYEISPTFQLSSQESIMNALNVLQENSENTVLEQFIHHFGNYINREKNYVEENISEEKEAGKGSIEAYQKKTLDNLENFLQTATDSMSRQIKDFMRMYGVRLEVIKSFFESLTFPKNNTNIHSLNTFLKNYLNYFCITIPVYITTGHKHDEFHTKSMLLKEDILKVNEKLQKKYQYLNEYINDDILHPFFEKIMPKLREFYKLFTQTTRTFPLDRVTLYQRYAQFCIIFIVHYLIQVTEDDNLLQTIFRSIRNSEEQNDEELLENDDDIQEVLLQNADRDTVQQKVLKFIQLVFDKQELFYRDKKVLLVTYDDIRKNVDRLEEDEKIRMMSRFDPKNMPEHRTRKAEKELKKYHLGRYYIDQKVINTYGKKRDVMLNTEDVGEDDFLMMDQNISESLEEIQETYNDEENRNLDDDDDDDEDEIEAIPFLQLREDDDNYDIAEYNVDN